MPSFKVLKGIAHNVGHSFTSLMNYTGDDYSMGHILKFARETGFDTLTIDLVNSEGRPEALFRDPIADLPHWYAKMFWHMVASSGSDRALVDSATLTLRYDLERTIRGPRFGAAENPYTCDVSIRDCRGKNYTAHFEGWWDVGAGTEPTAARRWWNPLDWFQR